MKSAEILQRLQKEHGEGIGAVGMALPQVPRLATGLLEFDLASGGGFPVNRMSLLYGTESSGKTNLALIAIRQFQHRYPQMQCTFIDVEGTLDTDWAAKLGVNTESLLIVRPDYGEQAVDWHCSLMEADDAGLLVTDSIAALISTAENEKSAEKETPGGQARLMGKMVRKSTVRLSQASRVGRPTTLIWINQIRMKIGVMFGNPETLPGGQGQLFMTALRVRTYGKDIIDPAVSKEMPCRKLTQGVIHKWKHPILRKQFEYEMATMPHGGLEAGYANDWPAAKPHLFEMGLLQKTKGGYVYSGPGGGEVHSTQHDFWEWLRTGTERYNEFQQTIIDKLMMNELNTDEGDDEEIEASAG